MRYFLFFILLMMLSLNSLCDSIKADASQLTIEAEAAFQRGLQAKSESEATQAFQDAIVRYDQMLREYPEKANGALYYNLGNAQARLNHIALAILNYRRAQLYRPNDANIRNNLNYLRTLRQDHFQTEANSKTLKTIFFWHYDLSYQCRFMIGGFLATLCAVGIAVCLFKRPLWLTWSTISIALLCVAISISLFLTRQQSFQKRGAVITADEVMPRNGDGDSYKSATDAPIHAGTEVIILQTRGEWYEITIEKRFSGWVKCDTLQEI